MIPKYVEQKVPSKKDYQEHIEAIHAWLTSEGVPAGDGGGAFTLMYRIQLYGVQKHETGKAFVTNQL